MQSSAQIIRSLHVCEFIQCAVLLMRSNTKAKRLKATRDIEMLAAKAARDVEGVAAKAVRDVETLAARMDAQFADVRQELRELRAEDKALRERIDSNHEAAAQAHTSIFEVHMTDYRIAGSVTNISFAVTILPILLMLTLILCTGGIVKAIRQNRCVCTCGAQQQEATQVERTDPAPVQPRQ